ncbi:DoxX family protein [Streptomyces sp. WMMB 322]|uniref:DoxX family protein n=1 Tax=Streptomyces sp. WMMB 322 TaxID=1286821 RepID=UPI0006E12957|nr:TQO small subunit DoxD [Streptomyces sp. WMMB 322]SCK28377.1 thiosulfate dehydrogenase [quinone] large subunit [Streptomyces sp. WMMB 322]
MSLADQTRTDAPVSGSPGSLRARASKYALLPLRLFLGATFIYAGLDKLVLNKEFLSGKGGDSLVQVLDSVENVAAIPALVNLAQNDPKAFGIAIAAGEIAVGLGALVGLLTRLAAFGGMLISLSLWLTVSWGSDPYYYGNDLPYMMAWVPLIFAGASVWSLDMAFSRRRRRKGRHIFG